MRCTIPRCSIQCSAERRIRNTAEPSRSLSRKGGIIMRPDLRGDDTGQALASDPVISADRRAECVVALQEHPSHGCAAGDVGRADSSEGRTDVAVMARFGGNNPSDAALAQTALLAMNQSALVPVGKVRPVVRNAWLLL